MKLLLHLMAKETRANGTMLACYWVSLGILLFWHGVARRMDLPGYASALPIVTILAGGILMTGLLQSFIQLDHPRHKEAFLHTRPVSATLRWLPKLLLWTLVVLLPALLVILGQMALAHLDLRSEDYLRVGMKAALACIGIFGAISAIAATVSGARTGLSLGLIALVLLMSYEAVAGNPANMPVSDMMQSRAFAASNLAGLGGFIFAGWRLAGGKWQTLLLGLAAVAILCTGAWFFWPLDVIHRTPLPVLAEPARLQELETQTQVQIGGLLQGMEGGYRTDPILINAPPDLPEWPRVSGFVPQGKTPELQNWTAVAGPSLLWPDVIPNSSSAKMRRSFRDPPMRENQLIRVLGLPQALAVAVNAHHHGFSPSTFQTAELRLNTSTRWPDKTALPVEGLIICDWQRPQLLTALPLRAGAVFTHDGHSVRITHVRPTRGGLALGLHLMSHDSPNLTSQSFDQQPEFYLCVAHPARGEIGLRGSAASRSTMGILTASEAQVEADYAIVGLNQVQKVPDAAWLEGARLFVLQRRTIGQTRTACRGELSVLNPVVQNRP